ncbi:MAG TPA: hypothetical protein VGM82_13320 [Gemmatimonadaceae bacterium]|jgi:hypothetical protein
MKNIHAWCGALLLVAATACRSDVVIPQISTVAGNWTRAEEIPGSSEQWTLTLAGNTIQGVGTWSGEACCSGPLAIHGNVAGDSIHVDVTMSVTSPAPGQDRHEHFDGALTPLGELHGTVTIDGGSNATVILRRQNVALRDW